MGAKSEYPDRAPTWIALSKGTRIIHLPTSEPVFQIKAGSYRVNHIDYGESKVSGLYTRFLEYPDLEYRFEPNAIYYVGELVVQRHLVRIDASTTLVAEACAQMPEIFMKLPVYLVNSPEPNKPYLLECVSRNFHPLKQ